MTQAKLDMQRDVGVQALAKAYPSGGERTGERSDDAEHDRGLGLPILGR